MKLERKNSRHIERTSQQGQAALEAILLLTIALIIVGGLLWRFSGAFRQYTADLFGNYYACLIETGELPGSQACAADFSNFNESNGRSVVRDSSVPVGPGRPIPPVVRSGSSGPGGGSGGGGSGSSSRGSGNSGRDGKSKDGDKKDDTTSGETLAGGANSDSGRSYSTSLGKIGKFGRKRGDGAGEGGEVTKEGEASESTVQALALRKASTSLDGGGARKKKMLNYAFNYGQEAEAGKTQELKQPITSVSKKDDKEVSLKEKKVAEKTRAVASAKDNSDGGGFSIGAIVRWVLIILIIAFIIVFFGNQILQISKSSEK